MSYRESLRIEGIVPTDKGEFTSQSALWENWEIVGLILYGKRGDKSYTFIFGKRALFHYECDFKSECLWKSDRKFVLENRCWVRGWKTPSYQNEDMEKLFEDFETVVIEEREARINFFFGLKHRREEIKRGKKGGKLPEIKQFGVQIKDAGGVRCAAPLLKQHRPCVRHNRVSYVTVRPRDLVCGKKPQVASHFEEDWSISL